MRPANRSRSRSDRRPGSAQCRSQDLSAPAPVPASQWSRSKLYPRTDSYRPSYSTCRLRPGPFAKPSGWVWRWGPKCPEVQLNQLAATFLGRQPGPSPRSPDPYPGLDGVRWVELWIDRQDPCLQPAVAEWVKPVRTLPSKTLLARGPVLAGGAVPNGLHQGDGSFFWVRDTSPLAVDFHLQGSDAAVLHPSGIALVPACIRQSEVIFSAGTAAMLKPRA